MTLQQIKKRLKRQTSFTIDDLNMYVKMLGETCPQAGHGVHQWIFEAAVMLHRWPFCLKPQKIADELQEITKECGRRLDPHEITDAVNNSNPGRASPVILGCYQQQLPSRSLLLQEDIILQSKAGILDLVQMSPEICNDWEPLEVLRLLVPDKVPVCLAYNEYNARTFYLANRYLQQLRWDRFPCLWIPSPLANLWGLTFRGKKSCRAKSNIQYRRYLYVEFDIGEDMWDEQARLVLYLKEQWKHEVSLVLVCSSGKKSLHSAWDVRSLEEATIRDLCIEAYQIGADDATFRKSQLVRVPNAIRPETGLRQQLYYFDRLAIRGEVQ